ncbi:Pyrin Marenostrin [Scomber scombrus]|uniref:Pyrin Marenostrin n=1 Tax=Scomber scombrus TaxID=13677 RepID=A0AAV1PMT7_SCOSC
MLVPELLLELMEVLDDQDFNEFKSYLLQNVLTGCKPMAKSSSRHAAVTEMIQSYGQEMAVNVTAEILSRMYRNNTGEELKKTYTEGAAAEQNVPCQLVPFSSALGRSARQNISAGEARGATGHLVMAKNGNVVINDSAPKVLIANNGNAIINDSAPIFVIVTNGSAIINGSAPIVVIVKNGNAIINDGAPLVLKIKNGDMITNGSIPRVLEIRNGRMVISDNAKTVQRANNAGRSINGSACGNVNIGSITVGSTY